MLNYLLYCFLLISLPLHAAWQGEIVSPDKQLRTEIHLDAEGRTWFQIFRQNKALFRPSPLGINLSNGRFDQGMALESASDIETVEDSYRMWVGKQKHIKYQARELRLRLKNSSDQSMVLTLRLSNDGLAYRYGFPNRPGDIAVVESELGGVHFFPQTLAWLQPKADAQTGWKNTNPSYEEDYLQAIEVGTPSPTQSGWVYPALFHFEDSWILLSETGMDGHYSGTNLAQNSEDGLYRIRFPQAAEVTTNGKLLPEVRPPFQSPWRLVLAGDLSSLAESTLGTDLANSSALGEVDFVQPGIAAWSWGLLKDENTVFPVQKAFVDYAADMNWPYVLVDADWDWKIGYEKIAELAVYAAGKGVSLLLWYNSSGDWNQTIYSPKSRLLTHTSRRAEFAHLQDMGIKGIKVDFFPGDGQSAMQYYQDILADAADFKLMVNFHGSTLPRGLQRTWPNLLTSEAVKGLEMITFFQDAADREATHVAMLPFTRNVFDPMDFTPMVLGDIPNIERKTSNGFQLALPVLLTSGIQHLVTTPEQMKAMPEFVLDYLRHIPGQWDDSRFLAGYPGKFVVIARRSGQTWYVAGINAETRAKTLKLDLSFIPASDGVLIRDGALPRQLQSSPIGTDEARLTLDHGAGFIMIFKPSTKASHE